MIKPIDKEKFPYSKFPIRLEHKDAKEKRICWFECEEHLNKYLKRHNLKKKDIKIETCVPE